MFKRKRFLSKRDEKEVVDAIIRAEKNTSGEIRVHVEKHTDKDHYDHAKDVFSKLGMHKTKLKNGVLIYIAVKDRKFVIIGDQGINERVANDFWEGIKNTMENHFRKGQFKRGIVEGVLEAGQALKRYFPYQQNDENELLDDVSKSK